MATAATTRRRAHQAAHATSRGARKTQRRARRARSRPLVARLAVASVAARGVVYGVLAYIAADIAASGARGKQADSKGALEEIARQPAGPALLVLLALGLAAYAAWRFLQAAAGDPEARDEADMGKRGGWVLIGLFYLGLAGEALSLAFGNSGSGSGGARSLSRSLLGLPGGRVVLGALGVGVVVAGLSLAIWAALQRFESYIDAGRGPEGLHPVLRVTETTGQVVRGVVFAGVGVSLLVAAVADTAREAKDIDGALRTVRAGWYGQPALAVIALGLAAFAVSSFLEARFRQP